MRKEEPFKLSSEPPTMTAEELKLARDTIRSGIRWTQAKSPRYQTCPHQYIIWHWEDCRPAYMILKDLVKRYGFDQKWRGHKYRFMVLDGCAYWEDIPAMNRSNVRNLEYGGYNPGYPCPDARIDYSDNLEPFKIPPPSAKVLNPHPDE